MGMDWLELMLDLEKEHGIAVDLESIFDQPKQNGLPDMTVGALHQYLTADTHRLCTQCHYALRALPCPGICPECGITYDVVALSFEQLRDVIVDLLRCKPDIVTADAWMGKDLGMN